MSRTTRELWLEDRRSVLDRRRDHAWWKCLRWVVSAGLVCALAIWGWLGPLLAACALTLAALAALLVRPQVQRPGAAASRGRLMDTACLIGLATVGGFGLIAVVGGWAVWLFLALTLTSPSVRRRLRNAGKIVGASRELVREMQTRRPPFRTDDLGWP